MSLREISPETLVRHLLEKVRSITFASGIPEAEKYDEKFFEEVAKPLGLAQDLEQAIEAETEVKMVIDQVLEKYCKPESAYEVSSEAGANAGAYLYVCDMPNIGKFYVVEYSEYNADTGRTIISYHFYREKPKAWLDFAEARKTIEEMFKSAIKKGIAKVYEAILPQA